MPSRSHHVVSRGYLRNFTNADGLIQVVWRDSLAPVTAPTGVGAVFKSTDFNTYRSDEGAALDELEREWARVEDLALPRLRRAINGEADDDVAAAIKVVAAMHLARSFATRELWDRTVQQHRGLDDAARERLSVAFEEDEGRPPRPGEVEAAFGAHFDLHMALNYAFVEQMVSMHNRLLEELPDHVQLVARHERASVGFITSDVPVVLTDRRRVGVLGGVAVREADVCFVPLSRDVAAFLTTHPEPHVRDVAPWIVQKLNHLVWQGSLRQIACHPAEDWRRALARAPRPSPAAP